MARQSAVNQDIDRMKYVHTELVSVPIATYDASTMKTLFDAQGIRGFAADFLSLSPEDVMHPPNITATEKRKLICVLSYYHSGSRVANGPIAVMTTTKQMFDEYRASLCDPTKPVIPWKTPIADPELDKWKRNVKPNGRDFPILKDEASYPRWKEKLFTTLDVQDLRDLITAGHVPLNPEAHAVQKKWLHKVFQDIMVAPAAKAIVTKNLTQTDTAVIWAEITAHCDNSMTAELQSQKISTHCTSVRFKSLNWRPEDSKASSCISLINFACVT